MQKKYLTLVRHAKSSWNNPDWTDMERPLNKRGEQDLPFMSELIAGKIKKPTLIYSSPAVRALTTAKGYAKALDYAPENINIDSEIYERGSRYIVSLLKELPESVSSIMVFGHNPDMTSLASYFTGEYFQNVPTCGTVHIEFEQNGWEEIEDKNGKLIFFEFPKMHKKKKA